METGQLLKTNITLVHLKAENLYKSSIIYNTVLFINIRAKVKPSTTLNKSMFNENIKG